MSVLSNLQDIQMLHIMLHIANTGQKELGSFEQTREAIDVSLAHMHTYYHWQPCLSSCHSSSLERSARSRRFIIIIEDFLPSNEDSDLFQLSYPHLILWLLDWYRYSGPCSNVLYLGHFKKFMFTYLLHCFKREHFQSLISGHLE